MNVRDSGCLFKCVQLKKAGKKWLRATVCADVFLLFSDKSRQRISFGNEFHAYFVGHAISGDLFSCFPLEMRLSEMQFASIISKANHIEPPCFAFHSVDAYLAPFYHFALKTNGVGQTLADNRVCLHCYRILKVIFIARSRSSVEPLSNVAVIWFNCLFLSELGYSLVMVIRLAMTWQNATEKFYECKTHRPTFNLTGIKVQTKLKRNHRVKVSQDSFFIWNEFVQNQINRNQQLNSDASDFWRRNLSTDK